MITSEGLVQAELATRGAAPPGASLLDMVTELGRRYETETTIEARKERGQFFTPAPIAAFMANQLQHLPPTIELLDAGAGVGTLTAAVCDRLVLLDQPRELRVTLYETDDGILPLLRVAMQRCAEAVTARGGKFSFTIRCADFILDNAQAMAGQPVLFGDVRVPQYDVAILNPPYYKLNKQAPQAAVMEPVVHGQPNAYALFMAMAAALLREGGQFVAITPRSFCNGLYFQRFRRWFFGRMQPRSIHVFGSRTDAFQEDKVLQENIVIACQRTDRPPATVRISRSRGRRIARALEVSDIPYSRVIDDRHGQLVVCIPEHELDIDVAAVIDGWQDTFTELGFGISTGPVVSFRARHFLIDATEPQAPVAPMLWMHNIKPFEVRWPLASSGKAPYIESSFRTRHLLVPTKNYVLVKRFSAKEERRRMTAGVLIAHSFPNQQVGVENHLNYVYRPRGELSLDEAFGLAGLFNSALLDRYFRMINGNTQVNATEVRTLPLPPPDRIRSIGRALQGLAELKRTSVEEVVLAELGVVGSLAQSLAKY